MACSHAKLGAWQLWWKATSLSCSNTVTSGQKRQDGDHHNAKREALKQKVMSWWLCPSLQAAGWKSEFVLILAATLDKSGMTITTWCHRALDLAAGYCVHVLRKSCFVRHINVHCLVSFLEATNLGQSVTLKIAVESGSTTQLPVYWFRAAKKEFNLGMKVQSKLT